MTTIQNGDKSPTPHNAPVWPIILTIALLSVVASGRGSASQQVRAPRTALDTLPHQTGWIPLGESSVDMSEWVTAESPTYELLDRPSDHSKPVLPATGERIRIVIRVPILIIDYARLGDMHRASPPLKTGRLTSKDETGLHLEPGDIVEVRAITVSKGNGLKFVFARVSPSGR